MTWQSCDTVYEWLPACRPVPLCMCIRSFVFGKISTSYSEVNPRNVSTDLFRPDRLERTQVYQTLEMGSMVSVLDVDSRVWSSTLRIKAHVSQRVELGSMASVLDSGSKACFSMLRTKFRLPDGGTWKYFSCPSIVLQDDSDAKLPAVQMPGSYGVGNTSAARASCYRMTVMQSCLLSRCPAASMCLLAPWCHDSGHGGAYYSGAYYSMTVTEGLTVQGIRKRPAAQYPGRSDAGDACSPSIKHWYCDCRQLGSRQGGERHKALALWLWVAWQ
eukprot:1139849-Pelagomonas_calceolata.AAC.3